MWNGLLGVSACNKYHRHHGFSLLEVLVAFVVMGLVVGVLLQLFATAMRSVTLADEYSLALQVAESRLATVGTEIPVKEGTETGEEQATGLHWKITMQPFNATVKKEKLPLPLQLYKVETTVFWQSDDAKREFHLSSLRFGEAK